MTKYRSPWIWLLSAAVAALLVVWLCVPDDVLARAGGGGGYSGGGGGGGGFGGGGGGGSGDGGGLGLLIYWLLQLCINRPLIGIPLVIFLIVMFALFARKGREERVGSVIRRGRTAQNEAQRQAAIASLKRDDPGFSEQQFYARVREAFLKVQQAWCGQDMTPVRAFISDGILERFSLQIEEQRERDYRDHMEQIVVQHVLTAQAGADQYFDAITVSIAASAIDFRESLSTGKRISGPSSPESFVEYWTFLRRHGVKTEEKPGLIEGACPNCGTDIRMNQSARCPSCDSVLRSGRYDWVLTEITQACEWDGDDQGRIVNLQWYREHVDPALQVRHLEDRASVVFWRKAAADRLADIRPLAKMASPEFCEQYERELRRTDDWRYWGECAVGSVDVLALLPGDEMDRTLVEVRWSGTRFTRRGDQPPRSEGTPTAVRTMFVLARKRGVKTNVDQTIASAHCPNCGAPESSVASNACEFCGEVLNEGSHDWVLTALHAMTSNEAQALVQEAREHAHSDVLDVATLANRPPQAAQQLAWAIKMALADNQLDNREMTMLRRAAAHRRIDETQLQTMIEAARRDQLDTPMPADQVEARRWLASLADASLWDGTVSQSEYKLLCQAGAAFNFSGYDMKQLLRERQSRMYRQARDDLRGRRDNGNGN